MTHKYAIVFGMLATLLGLVVWLTPFLLLQLLWTNTAIAFAALAVAYGGVGPGLLGKRPNGRRALWSWPIFWPYFLLNALCFWGYRLTNREPAFVEVVPGLFFGRRLTRTEAQQATPQEWQAILDLACEFAAIAAFRHRMAYRSLPILDATVPRLQELQDVLIWLRAVPGPVYVHCALGHGRSAMVVIAFLLATGQASNVRDGFAQLKAKRPGVKLHRSQRALLEQLATLTGSHSC